MKKTLKISGAIFLALFLMFGASLGFKVWSGIRKAKALAAQDITAPNLASVPDGTWKGAVEWEMLVIEAEVTVQDGVITDIELLRHDNGRGEKAEAIIEHVISAQSIEVDTISGATISSRAILKAIAEALNNSH